MPFCSKRAFGNRHLSCHNRESGRRDPLAADGQRSRDAAKIPT